MSNLRQRPSRRESRNTFMNPEKNKIFEPMAINYEPGLLGSRLRPFRQRKSFQINSTVPTTIKENTQDCCEQKGYNYPESLKKYPRSAEIINNFSFKSRPSFATKAFGAGPLASLSAKKRLGAFRKLNSLSDQKVKKSLTFNDKTSEEENEENIDPSLPPVDLTNMNIQGSLLSKKTHMKFNSNQKSQNLTSRALLNRCSSTTHQTDLEAPRLLARRSMVTVLPNNVSHSSPPAVVVTKPSVDSSDDELFVKPMSISTRFRPTKSTSYIKSNIPEPSKTKSCNSISTQTISPPSTSKCTQQTPKEMTDACTNTLVTGLHLTTQYQQTEQVLRTALQEQAQIIQTAERFVQNMKDQMAENSKVLLEMLGKSVETVTSISKDFENNFSLNEQEHVMQPNLDWKNRGNCSGLATHVLGTPMTYKKKTLRRSLSHPQMNTVDSPLSEASFHSVESLSPFTNMAGDYERLSLMPLTPKTRTGISKLKNNLHDQFDILFN